MTSRMTPLVTSLVPRTAARPVCATPPRSRDDGVLYFDDDCAKCGENLCMCALDFDDDGGKHEDCAKCGETCCVCGLDDGALCDDFSDDRCDKPHTTHHPNHPSPCYNVQGESPLPLYIYTENHSSAPSILHPRSSRH